MISILDSTSLGMFYMDISLTLRESMLLNGILPNSEVWYNIKNDHIHFFESADIDLMRQICKAHSETAIETAKIHIL